MRKLLPCLPTLVLCAFAGRAAAQSLDRETVGRLRGTTVFIRAEHENCLTGEKAAANGSGFFIHRNGYLVTNWHVVDGQGPRGSDVPTPRRALSLKVYVNSGRPDERVYDAAVVAADRERDLAVLAILGAPAAGVTALEFGDPGGLYETSPLWAAGYPLGERFSVIEKGPEVTINRGAVTSLRHDDTGALRAIQIDAPLDSGNSGGPLVSEAGRVMGVTQSIVVNNRAITFAVPSSYAAELAKGVAMDGPWKAKGTVSFTGAEGTEVFVDGTSVGRIGKEPLRAEVPLGMRRVAVSRPGTPARHLWQSLRDGGTVDLAAAAPAVRRIFSPCSTEATAEFTPMAGGPAAELPAGAKVLWRETFDERPALDKIEQSTGGTSKRTWYVRDGRLHQHESDEMLHAACCGEAAWADYVFSADVTIRNEQNDSRAGLIFRESPQGFYLFRLHRETDQAQLSYHCKSPFGWFILEQRKLDFDLRDQTCRLEVRAAGQDITCLVDGRTVFAVRDRLAGKGRVGFYSVESQADFDNAEVRELAGGPAHPELPDRYPMFWFSDQFDDSSSWWSHRLEDGSPTAPWLPSEAGTFSPGAADGRGRLAVMENSLLTNYSVDLIASLKPADAAKEQQFGFVFARRKTDAGAAEYRLLLAPKDKKVRLCEFRDGKNTVLRAADFDPEKSGEYMPAAFGGAPTRLLLQVDGTSVRLLAPQGEVFSHEFGGKIPEGRLGFFSQGVSAVFHAMTVTSPVPRKEAGEEEAEPEAEEKPPAE